MPAQNEIQQPIINDQQAQQDAATMNQQLQINQSQVPPLPQDQYASILGDLSAWAARKVIKETKIGEPTKKLSDMLIERKIEAPKVHPKQTPTHEPQVKPMEKQKAAGEAQITLDQTAPQQTVTHKQEAQIKTQQPLTIDAEKEAAGIVDAKVHQFDPGDSWQMNFDTIESEDDIKAVIGAVAEKNKVHIDEARRGVVTDEQLRGLAYDLGQSPEFITNMLNRKEGMAVNAESVMASRQVLEKSALKLKELAMAYKANPQDQKAKFDFSRQYQFHSDFMAQFMGMRAEFGRGLRAFGVPQGTNEVKIDRMMEVLQQVDNKMDLDKLADNINMMDSTQAINQMTQATGYGKFKLMFDSAYEIYINSILSGFKTHLINGAGSVLRMGADIIDTKVAAHMGAWTPDPTDVIKADEYKALFFGQISGSEEASKIAWQVAKTGEPYGGVQKLDSLDLRSITATNYGLSDDSMLGSVVNGIGAVLRSPTERLMGGTDAYFRKIAERSSIAQVAYRKASAIAKHNGMNQEDALSLLKDLMENPTDDMLREATDKSLAMTFQTPLGETGRAFQRSVHKVPGGRYLAPFIKTPANLMKQGFLERTPIGFISTKLRQDIMDGGSKGQMARSKMFTGTALATSIYMLAANGKVTGSEPQDKAVARARKAQGWRPMSWVVENDYGEKEYISFARMEPFSYIIGGIADIHDYLDSTKYTVLGEDDQNHIERLATAAAISLSENTIDRSFMTGIRDFMNFSSDPKRYGKQLLMNYANSFIPFSGLRRDLTRIADDQVRTHQDTYDYIQKNIPFLSSKLPPARDVLGNEVKYDAVLNPWPKVVQTRDSVLNENGRLAERTKQTALSMPTNKIGGVELTNKEYDDLVQISRKEIKVDGRDYQQTVEQIINSSAYKSEKLTDDDRVQILRDSTRAFDEGAKKLLLDRNKDLMRKVMTRKLYGAAKHKAQDMGIPDTEALKLLQDQYLK